MKFKEMVKQPIVIVVFVLILLVFLLLATQHRENLVPAPVAEEELKTNILDGCELVGDFEQCLEVIEAGEGPREVSAPAARNIIQVSTVDLLYLVTMVVGVIAKAAWDTINDKTGRPVFLRRSLLGFIVTPVVYLGVSAQFEKIEFVTLTQLAIAFQSGFFYQALLENAQQSVLTRNQPPQPA